jgi:hypothetical protein
MTLRAFHGSATPSTAWQKDISVRKGSQPSLVYALGGITGAGERDRTSGLLITNQLAERFKLLISKIVNMGEKSIVLKLCSPAALSEIGD